jgi:hypothetical protein
MQFWTGEVRLIRVVVRRFAPRSQRIFSAAPGSRARSVRDNRSASPAGPSAKREG